MKEYPEPIWNAENMNRKKGDTTFKTCGWCKFASCGRARYDCMIDTHCDLMTDYGEERDVKWDTKCKILNLGLLDIKDIIESKKRNIKDNLEQNKNTEAEIRVLLNDKRIPRKNKPALPDSRGCEYFKLKSVVWVLHENKWNRGIVVSGYRTYDGCVSYVLDDYPESQKGWGCGMSVPGILLDWEYKYFKNNLEEYREYLKLCDREYNGEKLKLNDYYKAMEGKI
jgi:hypothetical protein